MAYQAGDTVKTSYGVGVIVRENNGFYSVRLWRIPGKAVSSSSLAYLRSSAILDRLPAAPGMLTQLASGDRTQVLVHCYYQDRNTFLVSTVADATNDEDDENGGLSSRWRSSMPTSVGQNALRYQEVAPEQLESAQCAKFYPVLETLMTRAEQAATATRQLLRSDSTKRLVDSAGKVIQERAQNLQERAQEIGLEPETLVEHATNSSGKLENLAETVEAAKPDIEESFNHVMKIVKDEDVTALFEKCKDRLEQLVQTDLTATTQQALHKAGIRIQLDDSSDGVSSSSFSTSMDASRKAALDDLQKLLQEAELDDLDKVRGDLTEKFTVAFDSLSKAAKSDRGLNDLFENIAEKTTEWQEATGRLMSTRSASLFLEGASRIQARAAAIFNQNQFQWAGEIGSKLTKSFTEGDVALARLKSVELGEAVKSRLIEAIEVRSESLGGLDGIIAGALTTVKGAGSTQLPDLLKTLQRTSSAVTMDAHETLISVLSSQSSYRDQALLRIEQALCDLGDQIGDDLSPDEIAALVRGEGGTAKLFEPIANRAMKQIEKQLDAAEAQVEDSTVLEVLTRVRKIMSGELTVSAIMDDIVNVLNDDKVVAAGETIVQQSEQVLDVIEGVSANQAVADAMQIAEKAGITKDSVMREFEKLNVDNLLGAAGDAVTDEKARRKLISSATDAALDFVLRILPSMPVPPFEGVKDGLVYRISNLSMEGFRVRKEDIQIELAGMRATRRPKPSKIPAHVPTPDIQEEDSVMEESDVVLAESNETSFSGESTGSEVDVQEVRSSVKATELLIIDIRNISAVLENALWSFEQTYLPYLKGDGSANVKMSGAAIRLQFELRKRLKQKEDNETNDDLEPEWEPVLCLHDRSCKIEEVHLSLDGGGKLAWIFNKLAGIFKGPLRDYVVRTIVGVLTSHSGWILERLNTILSPYWELILRTAHLRLDDLVEADDDVVVAEAKPDSDPLIELVWRERLPLGMNLLMNDDSGVLKVVDFPRGSQARAVCEKRGFEPDAFKGASIIAVNGSDYIDQDDLFDALKDPARPKTVAFKLADGEEAERLRKFIEGENASDPIPSPPQEREFGFHKVIFEESGDLGIEFGSTVDNCLEVRGFVEGDGGIVLAAERSGDVKIGDLLTHINDEPVINLEGGGRSKAIELLESAGLDRPLSLTFTKPYLHKVDIKKPSTGPGVDSNGGPSELLLGETKEGDKRRIIVQGFKDVSGMAESTGIFIGDHLVFVNGLPVGAGCRWLGTSTAPSMEELFDMLKDELFYPIGLTFARPRQKKASRWTTGFSDDEAETMCVTAESQDRIGCVFGQENKMDVVVTDFLAVPGIFQRALSRCKNEDNSIRVSIDSIDGQFVPSYATINMIRNALERSWKTNEKVQLLLCDDELKKWLHSEVNNVSSS